MKDGGPAFPLVGQVGVEHFACEPGMALRDWFAGQALTAIIAKVPTKAFRTDATLYRRVGVAAFYYADAMLAARGEQHGD
ncbi:hypothetical protein ACFP76_11740 [Paracoccus aerius]